MDTLLTTTGLTSSQLGGALAAIGVGAVLISKLFASPASSTGSSKVASKKKKAKQKKESAPQQRQKSQQSQQVPKPKASAEAPKLSKSQKKRAKQKQKEQEAKAETKKQQGLEKKKGGKSNKVPKKSADSADDLSEDNDAFFSSFQPKKNKKVEKKKPSGPLSEKQKKAAKRQEQARLQEERKETTRTLTLQGAVPAPLSNLERWDTAGFEVVGSKKKKRSPKVQASSPGENVSVSRRGGLSMSESTSNSSEVEIDPRHFGLIIGEKGATLMKLQADHGVQINVPKRDEAKKTVTISSSSKDSINKARQAIKLLIQGGSAVSELFCPPEKIGIVIGPGGKNIKALQESFKVRVNTPSRDSGSNKVIITGEKPGVKAAKEAVKMLIAQGFSPATHPGWEMQEVGVEFEYFRFVIGPGGQTIKSIQGDTKTRVNLPQTADGSSSAVTVIGPKEGVQRAIAQIERAVARGQAASVAAAAPADLPGGRKSWALDANDPNAFSDDEF